MTAVVYRPDHPLANANGMVPRDVAPAVHGGKSIYVMSDLPGYRSPLGTGWIEGRAARREDLKRGNCREVDPGEWSPRREVKRRDIEVRPIVRD